ncbi:MAG: UTP--glucose-1-phosphate uridylyltransferase [Candidatus Aminicenantales bacterium]
MSVRKAIIPAAGFGTRFLPATKAVPKEMLAVVDKPMIQYAVEEAASSGMKNIGIVTSPWKTILRRHFGRNPELEEFLKSKGEERLAAEMEELSRLAEITFIEQREPRGLGHAVLMGEAFVGDEPFAVLNPDTIYDCPVPCAKQLSDVYEKTRAAVVVLGRIDKAATGKHGVVRAEPVSDRVYRVLDLAEKPGPEKAFSDLAVLGRYIFTPDIFAAIKKTAPGIGGEIQITDAIRILLETRPVYGVLFEGRRFDAGDKFGFLEATLHFALKRPEFRDGLRNILKTLNG